MKKIHLLWLLAGLLTLATGCSEEDYSELTSSQKLEIVKSDVNFSAEASQGVIEVKTDRILNATSSEEWCTTSISGNIVTVHVESLIAREGRSALITLSDGVKKAQVTVHQAGIIWGLQGEKLYFVPAEANEVQIPAKISCEYDTDFAPIIAKTTKTTKLMNAMRFFSKKLVLCLLKFSTSNSNFTTS